jgi:exosome complex RNA-binding protein Rrp4
VKGRKEMEDIVEKAIDIINREAHTSGLTDRIKEFLEAEREKISKS